MINKNVEENMKKLSFTQKDNENNNFTFKCFGFFNNKYMFHDVYIALELCKQSLKDELKELK